MRYLAEILEKKLEEARFRRITGERVLEVFGIDPDLVPANPAATVPFTEESRRSLVREYPWDPYGLSVAP